MRISRTAGRARAWTWHEAADCARFYPRRGDTRDGDLVWIGNWGDDERTAELHEFLIEPVRRLGLRRACPRRALSAKRARRRSSGAGIEYGGWLPNYEVPEVFARFRVTVHVPRRPYVDGAARHPDDPAVRGAGVRHPAGLRAVDDDGRAVHARRGLPRRRGRRRDDARSSRALLGDPSCARGSPTTAADHPRAPHLRPPRRRAARDRATTCRGTARTHLQLREPSHEDRVLRLEPGVRLLERRRHLLPRHRPRPARAAATTSPSTSPTPTSASSTATSPTPTGRRWSSTRATGPTASRARSSRRSDADVIVKASGVGVFDELLEARGPAGAPARGAGGVLGRRRAGDARPRARRTRAIRSCALIPQYDVVFTYGGGDPVVDAYARARRAAVRARSTTRSIPTRTSRCRRIRASRPTSAFLGNRLPDREARVEEFFLAAAAHLPRSPVPARRQRLGRQGHAARTCATSATCYTRDHNAFNCTPRAVLNVTRESMARYGFSPATRVFEAAGAGACLITDAWEGIELFLEPGREVLVAPNGEDVAAHLRRLTPGARAQHRRGRPQRACWREHTYAHRAAQVVAAARPSCDHRWRPERACPTASRSSSSASRSPRRGATATRRRTGPGARARRARARRAVPRARPALVRREPRPAGPAARADRRLPQPRRAARRLHAAPSARPTWSSSGRTCPTASRSATGSRPRRAATTAFYDIDTPVTLAALAAGQVRVPRARA